MGEALAEPLSLILLLYRREAQKQEDPHPNPWPSSTDIATLREPVIPTCDQTGVICCICTHLSKCLIFPKDCSSQKSFPALIWERWWAGLAEQGFQILSAALQSSYWYFQCLVEHPWFRSCTRPDCRPQGQCRHINFQPMQWLKGWLRPWWISWMPGFSSFSDAPWSFHVSLTLFPQRVRRKGDSLWVADQMLALVSKSYQCFPFSGFPICKHGTCSSGHLTVMEHSHSHKQGPWICRLNILMLPLNSYVNLGSSLHPNRLNNIISLSLSLCPM